MCKPFRARRLVLLIITLLSATVAQGQQSLPTHTSEPPPIADNSFLIEEAYNQEDGVVQHINTFTRNRNGDFAYTFTQEWPVTGQRHQFSYTILLNRAAEPGDGRGFGDMALNYRYQLVNTDRVAVAPRASLLLPTGDEREGLSAGGVGFQFTLPISTKLSRRFVAHTNAGATFTPHARNAMREKASTQDYLVGQSVVWLAKPRFNVLVEALYEWLESPVGNKLTARENSLLLNPGIRWAHNFKSGLQIVPGVSLPVGIGPSWGEHALFFYLSFEHPFRKE
jgi:hypothetical protein